MPLLVRYSSVRAVRWLRQGTRDAKDYLDLGHMEDEYENTVSGHAGEVSWERAWKT